MRDNLSRIPTSEATPPVSGVYLIRNVLTNKVYVGSSKNVNHRWRHHHRALLRKNRHWNGHLQSAFNLNGEANFTFELIEQVPVIDLLVREQVWLDHYRAYEREYGYNLAPRADRSAWGDESRQRVSCARKGKPPRPSGWKHSDEAKALISAASKARTGRIFSSEHREKLGRRTKGRTYVELYGPEKAAEIIQKQSLRRKKPYDS